MKLELEEKEIVAILNIVGEGSINKVGILWSKINAQYHAQIQADVPPADPPEQNNGQQKKPVKNG